MSICQASTVKAILLMMVPLLNTARMSPMRSFRCTAILILILLPWPTKTDLLAEDTGPSPPSSPPQRDVPDNIFFTADFEHTKLGIYTEEQLNQEWNSPEWSDGIEERRVSVVTTDSETRAIAVTYPAHTYGPEKNGAVWKLKFDASYSAVEVHFDVMFRKGFDFVRGGKLPGLFGGEGNTGGKKPTGRDGFSARMMWREDGRAVQYLYYPDQPTRYGHQIPWIDQATGQPIRFIPGQWHTVVHRVCMNTPGKRDGTLQAFFDNQPVLKMDSIRFRDTDAFAIDGFLLSTFFGGGDASWETTAQETIYFDNFQIIKIAFE
jgi:hypothetical protein